MTGSINTTGILSTFTIWISVLMLSSCDSQLPSRGKVIFTQIPVQAASEESLINQDYKYLPGMRIAMADMGKSLENIEMLSDGFFSVRAPEISFDGELMVFSGQQSKDDVWQIWSYQFKNKELSQVTNAEQNCTDPLWLPDGRIGYSKQIEDAKAPKHHALFSCAPDGTDEMQITFQPHEDVQAGILSDGRILMNSKQVYPIEGLTKYLAVHPDGTKAELFYQPSDSSAVMGRPWETLDGKVVFAASGKLNSIRFNRPLHSRKEIKTQQGTIISIFPMDSSTYLAAAKKSNERSFGLTLLSDASNSNLDFNYKNAEYHALEPVVVIDRPVPKKLPSTVMTDRESGFFICMNADQSDMELKDTKASKVQVWGIEDLIGEIPLEADGSFYVEIGADRPVRFQTLDSAGAELRGPSSWMWVRPNERRGCVGCHEDREFSPPNVVPLAIEKSPTVMLK